MNKNLTKKKKKGFTLIELIVVIAILGVLAAVAIPRFAGQTSNAKTEADKITAKNIAMAVQTELTKGTATITDDATAKTAIASYFTTFPTPQSGGTFTIVFDANKNVTIKNGSDESAKTLYP